MHVWEGGISNCSFQPSIEDIIRYLALNTIKTKETKILKF